MLFKILKFCIASSQVGDIIKAPNPSNCVHLLRYKTSNNGIKNAKVLPDPVRAAPRISCPLGDLIIERLWISVLFRK